MNDVSNQLHQASELSDWSQVESLSRQWLSQIQYFLPHLFLIRALLKTDRYYEADQEFEKLLSYKFNITDQLTSFPEIEGRYRQRLSSHWVLSTMRSGVLIEPSIIQNKARRWEIPHSLRSRDDFLTEATRIFHSALQAGEPVAADTAVVCTIGSCFAANLARVMNDLGMTAFNLLIEESINSTYANRILLEVVCGTLTTDSHRFMNSEFGEAFFNTLRERLSAATHVVLTVGVAPSFFSSESGEFIFSKNYRELLRSGKVVMRTTTCTENIDNIREMLRLIERLSPLSRKVITVSPVPLAGTTEMPSVIVADCVSKSILRSAVHEVVSVDKNVVYFPAFEVVRWLSAYSSESVFGSDDQNSRHVSNWVVEFIVNNFIKTFLGKKTL